MADNPYLIHGSALISFSGGRTSAYNPSASEGCPDTDMGEAHTGHDEGE